MRRVIGQSGEWFLIDIGDGPFQGHRAHLAIVFDRAAGRVFDPFPLDSILARGGWNDVEPDVDDEQVLADLASARAA